MGQDRKVHWTTEPSRFGDMKRRAACDIYKTEDAKARLTVIEGAVTCEACKRIIYSRRIGSREGPVIVEK